MMVTKKTYVSQRLVTYFPVGMKLWLLNVVLAGAVSQRSILVAITGHHLNNKKVLNVIQLLICNIVLLVWRCNLQTWQGWRLPSEWICRFCYAFTTPIIISHLCPVCLSSLLCVHSTFKIIPFTVFTSHLYFGYFISSSVSFEVISHKW